MLVLPDATSPTDTLRTVRVMMVFLVVSVAINYSFMISKDTIVLLLVMLIINNSVNIYKERNRCVFESIQKSVYQMTLLVKEEIDLYRLTFRGEVLDQGSDQASQQQLNS
jgi:predicted membrane-bound mannosyltransferase